ncbi:hypothetical protein LMK08_14120 [Metapseudomonas furukawaii]|uniref:DUF7740 domain-containing protein n=1 Tax=Metapseudomonas furukawaii TaxID=1149133 RepID=UPI00227C4098|nr:hypothetical protein [Pseudomonas furukawaii]WAG76523.1 hypothetical protein LMK08_14120 [Pseudomonas furukawaii]
MNLQDATLALFLTARLHGNNAAIKATAKRCAKLLPRSKRDLMYAIVDSSEPLRLVNYLAEHLD